MSLQIDENLIEVIQAKPGCSQNCAATAVGDHWSITYARNRIIRLIAQGKVRAEVDRSGRHKLFIADEAPMPAV